MAVVAPAPAPAPTTTWAETTAAAEWPGETHENVWTVPIEETGWTEVESAGTVLTVEATRTSYAVVTAPGPTVTVPVLETLVSEITQAGGSIVEVPWTQTQFIEWTATETSARVVTVPVTVTGWHEVHSAGSVLTVPVTRTSLATVTASGSVATVPIVQGQHTETWSAPAIDTRLRRVCPYS
ncbi:hypothetical protein KEM52_003294 [Ascosphaera acerosa]|nr:hypothetical protein KEM52_003294 [Ascosphaera acerosa]